MAVVGESLSRAAADHGGGFQIFVLKIDVFCQPPPPAGLDGIRKVRLSSDCDASLLLPDRETAAPSDPGGVVDGHDRVAAVFGGNL